MGALQAAGHEVVLVGDTDALERASPGVEVLVVDLTFDAANRIGLKRPQGVRTLGFYSHVEAEVREAAERAGFDAVWASDHFQPWQDNEGHAGFAWITLAALGQKVPRLLMGTGVTCPTFRYRCSGF